MTNSEGCEMEFRLIKATGIQSPQIAKVVNYDDPDQLLEDYSYVSKLFPQDEFQIEVRKVQEWQKISIEDLCNNLVRQ